MKRYLLDSNAVSDCIFRQRGVADRVREARLNGDLVGTAIPVVAELLGGIENSTSREPNLVIVNRNLNLFRLWPLTLPAARAYARIYADLRRAGRRIQVVDMMIAAIAKTLGKCIIVTTDSDLSVIPGVDVENWAD